MCVPPEFLELGASRRRAQRVTTTLQCDNHKCGNAALRHEGSPKPRVILEKSHSGKIAGGAL